MGKNNYIDLIKYNVSMQDILDIYGIDTNSKGFFCCPFHSEKTPSCKRNDKSYYCFGCGSKGDVIDFVMNYENIDMKSACKKIDVMFSLGIFDNTFSKEQEKIIKKRVSEKEKQKEEEKSIMSARENALDMFIICDRFITRNRPKQYTDHMDKAFAQALRNREYWWYMVVDCEIKLWELKERINNAKKKEINA